MAVAPLNRPPLHLTLTIPPRLRFCTSTALEAEPLFDVAYLVAAAMLDWIERHEGGELVEWVRPLPAPSPANGVVSVEIRMDLVARFRMTLGEEVGLEAAVVEAVWGWVERHVGA